MNWYAFKTQPVRELLAVQHLENQEFEVLMPMMKTTVRRNKRLQDTRTPLFPGYGFVRFDGSIRNWRSINATRGVSYLIAKQDRPSPLDDDVIASICALVEGDGAVSFRHVLKPGDTVEFTSGPFARQIGKLTKMDKNGRIEVLLKLVSGAFAIRTDSATILPVA